MTMPEAIREEVRAKLWAEADRLSWSSLGATDKARYYSIWTEAAELGGRLAGFMDPRQVRVYIKDTLLKSYTRERMADPARVLRLLGLNADEPSIATYVKPHGRRLSGGREIAWSRAAEWKSTLMALHERAFRDDGTALAAVLFDAGAKFSDAASREVVDEAARRLAVGSLIWLD